MSPNMRRDSGPRSGATHVRHNDVELAAGSAVTCSLVEGLGAQAMEMLELCPGETVLFFAWGTDADMPMLADAVSPAGRVIGVDLSPDMATVARQRVAAWLPGFEVSVVQETIESFEPGDPADAVLLCFAHDLLQSPQALQRLLAASKPGARVVVLGVKTLPWLWGWPVNIFTLYRARRLLTTHANLDRPWRLLTAQGARMRRTHSDLWGSAYIAVGRMPYTPIPRVTPDAE